MTQTDWMSVLRLSTMWELLDIRELAIKGLSKTNMIPVDKILLARECKVPDWLIVGYEEIAKRTETITDADAERLGWQAARPPGCVPDMWSADRLEMRAGAPLSSRNRPPEPGRGKRVQAPVLLPEDDPGNHVTRRPNAHKAGCIFCLISH